MSSLYFFKRYLNRTPIIQVIQLVIVKTKCIDIRRNELTWYGKNLQ